MIRVFRAILSICVFALCLQPTLPAGATTFTISDISLGMTSGQITSILGPSYQVRKARPSDPAQSLVLFWRHDDSYLTLYLNDKAYYVEHMQLFTKGDERNVSEVLRGLVERFGTPMEAWPNYTVATWVYDEHEVDLPRNVIVNDHPGLQACVQRPYQNYQPPPDINRATDSLTGLEIPTQFDDPHCGLIVRAVHRPMRTNPQLMESLDISMLDRRGMNAHLTGQQNAGEAQRNANAEAAKKKAKPF